MAETGASQGVGLTLPARRDLFRLGGGGDALVLDPRRPARILEAAPQSIELIDSAPTPPPRIAEVRASRMCWGEAQGHV